jgi:hypothetical protein
MTIQEYYNLREIISAEEQTGEFLEYIRKILEIYPLLEDMTMADAREYLDMKYSLRDLEIQKELGVI